MLITKRNDTKSLTIDRNKKLKEAAIAETSEDFDKLTNEVSDLEKKIEEIEKAIEEEKEELKTDVDNDNVAEAQTFERWLTADKGVLDYAESERVLLKKDKDFYDSTAVCDLSTYKEKKFEILKLLQENKARYQNYNSIANKLAKEDTPPEKLEVFKQLVFSGEVREDLMPNCRACKKNVKKYKKTPDELQCNSNNFSCKIRTKLIGENRVAQTDGDVQAALIEVSNSKDDVSISKDMLKTFRDNAVGSCHAEFDPKQNSMYASVATTPKMVLAGVTLNAQGDFNFSCKEAPAFCRCLLYISKHGKLATFENGPDQKVKFETKVEAGVELIVYEITSPGGQRRRRLLGQSSGNC